MKLEDWIAREAISFSLDHPETLNAAVDQLISGCDPALEILGLGEPTHLVNDYLRLRNRLFQVLVERHGFSAIAIESSFTRGDIANDFIAGKGGSIDDATQRGITHNMGTMPGNRELLEWMRQHNASHPSKLRFYGFDSPTEMMYADSPRQLLAVALDYLATLNPSSAASRREKIEPLIGNDAEWENTAAMMDPTKSIGHSPSADTLRVVTEDMIAELETLQPQGISIDASAYRRAMRHAVHARQMLAYHAVIASSSPTRISDCLGLRDAMMADNLRYINEQEKGRGKVLVFAHNSHLKRGQSLWQWGENRLTWWPAGAHLAALMGSKYAVIGVGAGTSTASNLVAPETGTLESHLLSAPGPLRIIPTHLGKALEISDIKTRTTDPRFFPFTADSLTDFDFLALLDKAE